MRTLPAPLASHLAGGVTSLCRCWRLVRSDGVTLGFTDHDRDLTFDGVTFAAASGLAPSEAETQLGMAVAGGEVSGALTSAAIAEADIAAGLYDAAEVTTYLVNWADVSQRMTLDAATVGEIRRSDQGFVAEMRGVMHLYDQQQGRLFLADCSADLGDSRCKVALAGLSVAGTVDASPDRYTLSSAAVAARPAGWFTGGRLTLVSGANAGRSRMVKTHATDGVLHVWEAFGAAIAPGDAITVTPGCDKTFETCQGKFANLANFRGFPHIPTPSFILTYARTGEAGLDGGLLDP